MSSFCLNHHFRRHALTRLLAAALALPIVICGLTSNSYAQSNVTDGAIDGYVTDSSGAAVPGVRLTATNLTTNVTADTVADANGYYRFPILKVGRYQVSAKAQGYSDFSRTGVTLDVGSQVRVDATLNIGANTASVTVAADASILETSTPASGATIDARALRVLPITSRNIYNYTFFAPGVSGYPTSTFSSPHPAFDGITSVQYQIDGLDNSQRNGVPAIRLVISTPEVVEQNEVIVNGASAEFGRTAGGHSNIVTRGGGNEYHGQISAEIRPNALRANNFLTRGPHPTSKFQDYVGNVGGPILKDRLFFFGNFEYNPIANPLAITITPANAAALGIPASALGSAIASERYPTPSVRVDYKINQNNNAFLRWTSFSNAEPNNQGGGFVPANTYTFFHDHQQGGEAQLTTVISPTLLNEFRFGVGRRDSSNTNEQPAGPNDSIIAIASVATIGNNPTLGSETTERNIDAVDNVTKTLGRHTFKFGVDYENTNIALTNSLTRTYTFANLASYLATINSGANSYQLATFQVGNPNINNTWNFFNGFAQDEWRLTPSLTVNYGLRYQFIAWPSLNQQAPYIPSRSIHSSYLDFAPRLSLAYQVSPSTVVRAASGLYFDTPNLAVFDNISQLNGANILTYTFTPTQAGAPVFPNIPTAAQEIAASKPSISAYDPNYRDLFSFQANAQVEHSFTSNFSVSLQYQFLTTRRGPYTHDVNLETPLCDLADGRPAYTQRACGTGPSTTITRPNAQFNQILQLSSDSNVNYNGLDVLIRERLSHGVQFLASYTWSKALGTVDQANSATPIQTTPIEDPSSLAREYGPLSSDDRHYFTLQGVYNPTFQAKGLNLINNLQFSTMTYLHSGLPFNVYAGSDLNGDGALNDRPLFTGHNSLRGPSNYEEDLRVSYDIPYRERYHLNLYSQAENLLNHPNWNCDAGPGCTSAVNNNVTSATFGKATSYRNPRGLYFGAKLLF